jgi:hypothetical protein
METVSVFVPEAAVPHPEPEAFKVFAEARVVDPPAFPELPHAANRAVEIIPKRKKLRALLTPLSKQAGFMGRMIPSGGHRVNDRPQLST